MFRGVNDAYTKQLSFGIQIEKEASKHSAFSDIEEGIFSIFLSFLSQKMTELNHVAKIKKRNTMLRTLTNTIAKSMEKKTIYELVNYLRETISGNLGYESAGFLFYSGESKRNDRCRSLYMYKFKLFKR